MEGTSNLKSTTVRTSWKDDKKVKFFLDCCINEVARSGRSGTSLRKESWDRVAKQMKEKYDMGLAQKQMKNQFDYLRSMYVEWSNLVNKNTGHGYNPVTKTMDWTPEKWDEYLKAHPKASAFRMSGFRWEEEGKALFEGVSATGSIGWGPASKSVKTISSSSTTHEVENEHVDLEESSSVEPSKKKKNEKINMLFTFVFAGWEGVAHDSRVLHEVAYDPIHCFPFPPADKYYLCDAAYAHTRFFMTPYRNTRYWISDFRRGEKPRSKEEVFNQAHAKLRNVIERTFGVLKARFRILDRMPSYSLETQRDIVIVCCAMHNYLRKEKVRDQLFECYEDPNICIPSSSSSLVDTEEAIQHLDVGESSTQNNQQFMIQLRDQIANTLMTRRSQTQR